jgi:hypothetical protein
MRAIVFTSLIVAGLCFSLSLGQEFKKDGFKKDDKAKGPPPMTGGTRAPAEAGKPGEVEIHFLNGSKIRATIQSETLEIASIYGKLIVPIQDVQAIEFGVHYPEGAVAKIEFAIKNLGSGDYRARETAAKTLLDLGPYAYPTLLRATRAKESEVAARAKEIVQKIQGKYPKKDLKTSLDDRVVTPTQTIVGRILTASAKTKAEYFGDIEYKFAHMRNLRAFTASAPDIDVAIDAQKYANAGQWLDTSFQLDGRSSVLITAKGTVDTWPQQPGQYMSGPGGNLRGRIGGFNEQQLQAGAKVRLVGNNSQLFGGMLIGKIGEDGEPFVIGDRYDLKSESEGKLYLHIGPSPWNCASTGTYDVKISRKSQ